MPWPGDPSEDVMYATLLNGEIDRYPLTLPQVRLAFPDVSFATTPDPRDLLPLGIVVVRETAAPEYDSATQVIEEAPPRYENGAWVQTWTVTDLTADEIVARTQARRAALVCTPRQARLALTQAGLLAAIEAWVAAAPDAVRIEWEYATEIRRNWPPITAAATALGLSDAQLDGLFELAMSL